MIDVYTAEVHNNFYSCAELERVCEVKAVVTLVVRAGGGGISLAHYAGVQSREA